MYVEKREAEEVSGGVKVCRLGKEKQKEVNKLLNCILVTFSVLHFGLESKRLAPFSCVLNFGPCYFFRPRESEM